MNRTIRITVNGVAREVEVPTYRTLLDCLRYDLGLTGSKAVSYTHLTLPTILRV